MYIFIHLYVDRCMQISHVYHARLLTAGNLGFPMPQPHIYIYIYVHVLGCNQHEYIGTCVRFYAGCGAQTSRIMLTRTGILGAIA